MVVLFYSHMCKPNQLQQQKNPYFVVLHDKVLGVYFSFSIEQERGQKM